MKKLIAIILLICMLTSLAACKKDKDGEKPSEDTEDTSPDKNEQDYAKDLSVHGELVRAIMPHILKDDTKTKENAARALRITFSALDNDGSSRL